VGLAKPQGAEEEEEEAAPAARFPALLHILSAPALAPKGPASCLVVPVLLTTALVHARGGGLSRATGRAYCYHSEGQN
jgi:hypothetical protein